MKEVEGGTHLLLGTRWAVMEFEPGQRWSRCGVFEGGVDADDSAFRRQHRQISKTVFFGEKGLLMDFRGRFERCSQ